MRRYSYVAFTQWNDECEEDLWVGGWGDTLAELKRDVKEFHASPDLWGCSPRAISVEVDPFKRLAPGMAIAYVTVKRRNGQWVGGVVVRLSRSRYTNKDIQRLRDMMPTTPRSLGDVLSHIAKQEKGVNHG